MTIRIFLCLLAMTAFVSCAGKSKHAPENTGWNAQQYYEAGKRAMEKENYHLASEYFETLETRFPFGKNAESAAFMLVEAYYGNQAYDSTIFAADRFIRLYTRNEKLDKVYYLKAIAQLELQKSLLQRIIKQEPSDRDLGEARNAFETFAELNRLFPKSEYGEKARSHMTYLRNMMAKQELNIAHYYHKRGALVAAAERANYVVKHFQGTSSVKEALVLMLTMYNKMGLTEHSENTMAILKLNYPNESYQLADD